MTDFIYHVYSPSQINYYTWNEVGAERVILPHPPYRCPLVPAPFVEKLFFSPIEITWHLSQLPCCHI